MISGVVLFVFGASVTTVVGAPAGVVSIVIGVIALGTDSLPASSVLVAVTLWSPSPSGLVGSILYVPLAHVCVGAIATPSTYTVTVSPSSQSPVIVGVVSDVLGAPTISIVGADAGVVSTVTLTDGVVVSFPASSVAVTSMVYVPSTSATSGVIL